jgi:hypothetical protein
VLWIGIVLLAAALLVAAGTTALVVTAAALAGVFWAAVAGGPSVQAAVAVGLVWLLLLGGLRRTILDKGGQDSIDLSGLTWIPPSSGTASFWPSLWSACGRRTGAARIL